VSTDLPCAFLQSLTTFNPKPSTPHDTIPAWCGIVLKVLAEIRQ
jgi:hypothetical protein